jgi:hypothetical protein
MAEYDQYFGVYLSIDKVIIPKLADNYYYFMTVCISTDSGYYAVSKKDISGIKFIYNINPE